MTNELIDRMVLLTKKVKVDGKIYQYSLGKWNGLTNDELKSLIKRVIRNKGEKSVKFYIRGSWV